MPGAGNKNLFAIFMEQECDADKIETKHCKFSSNQNGCVPKTAKIQKPWPNSTGQGILKLIVRKQNTRPEAEMTNI